MARRQVTCIKSKTGAPRHEYITHIGGYWGYNNAKEIITEAQAITDIDNGTHVYFTKDDRGIEATVKVVKHTNGKRFLTTNPDKVQDDNLSKLNECN
jgi:hypothetical protein